MGMTASFLPKPVVGVNGSGMHTNVSITKGGKNLFWDPKGEEKLSKFGVGVRRPHSDARQRYSACSLNASVNAYRRLDPHFEAPNQIKASAVDRGSMVRIPIGNEKSIARRSSRRSAPDANPYMVMYSIFKTGLDGEIAKIKNLRQAERYLPDNIYTALENFRKSEWTTKLLGEDVKDRYRDLKQASADRCPRLLGTFVKAAEVQYPPRGLQPVPLESVLRSESRDRIGCSVWPREPRPFLGRGLNRKATPRERRTDPPRGLWPRFLLHRSIFTFP